MSASDDAAPAADCSQISAGAIPPHRTGKDGLLDLSLRRDCTADSISSATATNARHHAKTILVRNRAEPPLSVQKALYCEESLPEMAYLYLSSTSGGMLQGDRHAVCLELGAMSRAHVTTQGATRIYGTNRAHGSCKNASQALRMHLEAGSYLEYVPDQIIPYANSGFVQDASISVHDTATMVYSEIISSGRIGMGESFAYRLCNTKMRITDQNGDLRFADASKIMPQSSTHPTSFAIMHDYDTVASMYIITEQRHTARLQNDIDKTILQDSTIAGGASVMSGETGVLVRLLGCGTESIKNSINRATAQSRKTILDAQFTSIRKS